MKIRIRINSVGNEATVHTVIRLGEPAWISILNCDTGTEYILSREDAAYLADKMDEQGDACTPSGKAIREKLHELLQSNP